MTTFIQLHMLTAYPAANLNRDDTGAPKTVVLGGSTRLRISSQSLKRAWRKSDLFEEALAGHIGIRSGRIGREAAEILLAAGINKKDSIAWAKSIAECFGKPKTEKEKDKDPLIETETEQLAHVSPVEMEAVTTLAQKLAIENRAPTADELELLRHDRMAVDIALFGRMLAATPAYNVEAACQVAHAFGVGETVVEDDFFTAVDDLRNESDDAGAGHLGETGFGAALFYTYVCIDRDLLAQNLNNDVDLVNRTLRALTETALKVSPTGKQNSFASRAYASWTLAEKGTEQPRSLAAAYYSPINGTNQIDTAVTRITQLRQNMNQVYGQQSECVDFNAAQGKGSLAAVLDFICS
ncbi:type I-E CRISPR-associated protein Cas7/Cse4/CasC [Atlantibacter subterraneus]|uniref:type I-E CRISPR-associated protein Cas7/Cse4/CasC n=1 Tax=Atlantibacter subterraneus TaxID=255519 RepID=UPI0029650375|nr:type I-E CRISPR-associated protein Cas7/Cse4/CasC [Atlantibacter subterranea]MDW2741847.1 type I-E CRISPR-associated protein Cas7/Cse4/CasC [Atlantibacter subterranea]